ncbi:L-cystine transporter [Penicillium argentinense]|uniref:L-cystine transporter n=1 Tax=Penicillium argentinense TaxID=1131581 RepID=A0A9W9EQP4_9EURO|nr:L-cystine transporter [Penicillium argentinense]KAJ5086105.1 L-cystine transporter [Penicillium argentinense]
MPESQLEIFVRALSRLLGWAYMFSWSASFYPQPIYNFQRKSTVGLSIDYPTVNFLGFTCYTIYTAAFLYSPLIRDQYAARHPVATEPTVRFNDFAFAAHATILSIIIYTQFWPSIWGFHVSRLQRISRAMLGLFWGSIFAPVVLTWIVLARSPDAGNDPLGWAWIDVIYAFSYIKLLITVVKYVPQAWLNYKRQSTVGWSIAPMLFDLAGGVLSLVQLVLDSSLQRDWSGITGNPVKLLLGNVTIFFDLIFIVQHYILYRDAEEPKAQRAHDPTTPLLTDAHGHGRRA